MQQESPAPEQAAADGRWVMPPVNYVNPVRHFCSLCGRPIARKYWQTGTGDAARIYCDPAHGSLQATYPVSDGRET